MSSLNIYHDYPLRDLNTFGINSVAECYIELDTPDAYRLLPASGVLDQGPFFILGGGSNVVLPDRYDGTVLHPVGKGVRLVEERDGCCYVEAMSGEVWADFVDLCIANGWYGLENLASIPGNVGAAPVQNVGAYGIEAEDVVHRVHCFDLADGSERWIDAADCGFGYRWSRFKGEWKNRFVVDRVLFRLERHFEPNLAYKALAQALAERHIEHPTARQLADTVTAVRDSKLPNPSVTGSAGSFFKNPIVDDRLFETLRSANPDIVAFPAGDGLHKLAAGWMIEHCGWKGRSLGRAGVYEKQALVLVNRGGCSGEEVRRLADAIVADVEKCFGVHLECEAIFV